MTTVRTRFAPSPTGYLHIGGARTALFSWLYARKHKGVFVLRIEDTDRERSTEEAVRAILEGMAWLGLDHDEGPFFQTQRFDRYRAVIEQLLEQGHAYRCYCSKERLEALRNEQMARKEKPRYDGRCRSLRAIPAQATEYVIRFRNPIDGTVVVEDLIHGRVVFQNQELDDLIIARVDGTPTYNFTVVVDDMDMGITHVIRGDDHLNNTPRQINIFRALGVPTPAYAHVPMILGADGQRLSKRHGAVSVLQYRDQGYLPEALLNYLVRLGWSYGDQEIFSREEMVERFDVSAINKSAAAFSPDKLLWLNQHYIKSMASAELAGRLPWYFAKLGIDTSMPPPLTEVVETLRERSKTLVEMAEKSRFFYQDFDHYDEAADRYLTRSVSEPLTVLRHRLSNLAEWTAAAIHVQIREVAEQFHLKLGQIAQPLRIAISGKAISPPIDIIVQRVGRERSLSRLDRAIDYCLSRP
ncbi:MAG TPA: glutamate--tRNA ligase [Gammaproteobacteria bacterium]|nr:glutamate--tRNA ligase [Gammaproteobacteria bacterium]